MKDMAASVLTRLRNQARETKTSHQEFLQLFAQEELLRRLSRSKYVVGDMSFKSISSFSMPNS